MNNALQQSAPLSLAPLELPDPAILAGQLAPSSISTYRRDMAAYASWCGTTESQVTDPASLARYLAYLAIDTTLSPNTINRRLSAVKRVSKEAAAQGYLSADIAIGFERVAGVKARALKGRQRSSFRTRVEPADMRLLCQAPDPNTLKGKRDRALLATLASSGVRISELANLRVGDIVRRGKGYLICVLGKTDIEPREAPLSVEAHELLTIWFAARAVESEFVFTAFAGRGSSRSMAKAMTRVAAWQTVQDYAEACGLIHIKPHDFRRFVGTQLAARDIRQAQKALGHKRIDTTARHYVLDELAVGLTGDLY